MLLIPAIDLKNGRCVRLHQGNENSEIIYSDDPATMALSFEEAGAKRIHLVDLDGAFRGHSINKNSIRTIINTISIPLQLGGGLRNAEDIERMLDLGISSIIVGTMGVKNPEILENVLERFPGEKIILGIDTLNRKVLIEGWKEVTNIDDVEFAKRWGDKGIKRIVFTDISRDGMLTGPNLEHLRDFAIRSRLKVVASGGVSSMSDLNNLKNLEIDGVDQVIVGKAIYEGRIDLKEAFKC